MQKIAIFAVLLAVFISYLTFAPPNQFLVNIEPAAYSANLIQSFDGPMQHNTILSKTEHLPVPIHGAESLAVWDNKMYASVFGGHVVRVEDDKVVPIAKIGNGNCDKSLDMHICGRPLGLRFNSAGNLYVVDAFHGLYVIDSVNATIPKVTQLLPISASKDVHGGASLFFDDITLVEGAGIGGGDVLYISAVSSKWDVSMFMYILFEHDSTGILLKYDVNARKLSVAATDFVFPNGVQVTDNKEAVIVCDLGRQRLMRTFIKGPMAGKTELFTRLPGECDNVRRSANTDQETYWVAFVSVRNATNPLMVDRLAGRPLVRKFLVRLMYLTGTLIEGLGKFYNLETLESFGFYTKTVSQYFFSIYASDHGMITEVNADGKIITAYSSPDGKTNHLSEVCEIKGANNERILFIGSYSNTYLGRLVIKN